MIIFIGNDLLSYVHEKYFREIPTERIYAPEFYRTLGIYNNIPPYFGDRRLRNETAKKLPPKEDQIKIEYLQSQYLILNGEIVTPTLLESKIKQFIATHPSYVILYGISDELPYKEYIYVLGKIWKVIMNYRNQYAIDHYGKEDNYTDQEERIMINRI